MTQTQKPTHKEPFTAFIMLSFRRLDEQLALIGLVLVNLEIPKFYGQNEKFMG